jgi:hypothetical protein
VPSVPPPLRPAGVGEDQGRWLCIPGLKGKRVDVVINGEMDDARSDLQRQSKNKSGHIEVPKRGFKEDQLKTPVAVFLDGLNRRQVKIAPRWLLPMRSVNFPPHDYDTVSIARKVGRVVVIGPDAFGGENRKGEYGLTTPPTRGHLVDVTYVRQPGERVAQTDSYSVESLCRSYNKDTESTKATNFFP